MYPMMIESKKPLFINCGKCGNRVWDTNFVGIITTEFVDPDMGGLKFVGYQRVDAHLYCGNCGHTVDKIAFPEDVAKRLQ